MSYLISQCKLYFCLMMIVLSVAAASGCASDEDPQVFARSWDYNMCPQEFAANVSDAHALAEQLIREHGYHSQEHQDKNRPSMDAHNDLVVLPKGFSKLGEATQAELYWHELTHILQYAGEGTRLSDHRRSGDEWRWAYEIQAYRQGLIIMSLTHTRQGLLKQIDRYADSLHDWYALNNLDRDTYTALTREILQEVVTDLDTHCP